MTSSRLAWWLAGLCVIGSLVLVASLRRSAGDTHEASFGPQGQYQSSLGEETSGGSQPAASRRLVDQNANRSPAGPAAAAQVVSGTVRDVEGAAVAGVEVLIVGRESPFGGEGSIQYNNYYGRSFDTDSDGRYEAHCNGLKLGDSVLVVLRHSPQYLPIQPEKHVSVPDDDVDFIVRRRKEIVIEASLRSDERPFKLRVAGGGGGVSVVPSVEGVARVELDDSFGGIPMRVSALVNREEVDYRDIVLLAGDVCSIEFEPEGVEICGQVVDAMTGNAVPDARVFMGRIEDAYSDDPIPYQRLEAMACVFADEHGEFCIRGSGITVSAWHPEFSAGSAQVVGDIVEIPLAPRGSIAGWIGPGEEVRLDRLQMGAADEHGRFQFKKVPAGAHRLTWDESNYRVWLEAGHELDMGYLDSGEEIRIALRGDGLAAEAFVYACGDREPGVERVLAGDLYRGEATMGRGEPGSYRVIGGGGVCWAELGPGRNEIQVPATAVLRVRASAGSAVSILPSAWPEHLASIAQRAAVIVPESGVAYLWSLEDGEHKIWSDDVEIVAVLKDEQWHPQEVQLSR